MNKSGRKKVLDKPEIQAQVLRNLELCGHETNAIKDVVSKPAYYAYKTENKEFANQVAKAIFRFKQTLWDKRPDLRQLAIEGLEINLKPFEQTTTKIYFDLKIKYDVDKNGKQVEIIKEIPVRKEITTWTKPPAMWAIQQTLHMDKKKENGIIDLSEIAEILKNAYTIDPRYEEGGEFYETQ